MCVCVCRIILYCVVLCCIPNVFLTCTHHYLDCCHAATRLSNIYSSISSSLIIVYVCMYVCMYVCIFLYFSFYASSYSYFLFLYSCLSFLYYTQDDFPIIGSHLVRLYYVLMGAKIGNNVKIHKDARLGQADLLTIGSCVRVCVCVSMRIHLLSVLLAV